MKNMIVSIDKLRPLEKVFRHHLKNLSKMILDEGIVHSPVIADKKNGIVLDGSHRYIFSNAWFQGDTCKICGL